MMTSIRGASMPGRRMRFLTLAAMACASVLTVAARGQDAAARPAKPADAAPPAASAPASIEPAVNTSAPVAAPAERGATPPPAKAAAAGTKPAASAGAGGQPARRGGPKASDRLELESTQITGNRELPKVLYIVPWKRPELGDLLGKPVNSLLDEVLAPVDRDVFRRENRYYGELAGAGPGSGGPGGAAAPEGPPGAPPAGGRSSGDEK